MSTNFTCFTPTKKQNNVFHSPIFSPKGGNTATDKVRDRSGVRVVVRVRPICKNDAPLGQILTQSCVSVLKQHNSNKPKVIQLNAKQAQAQQFTFDYVAGPDVSQVRLLRIIVNICRMKYLMAWARH